MRIVWLFLAACWFLAAAGCAGQRPPAGRPTPTAVPTPTPTPTPVPAGALPHARTGDGPPLRLQMALVSASNDAASAQHPAYVEAEVAGFGLARLVRLAGRYEPDGRRRLVVYEEIPPAAESWRDGVHEFYTVWPAEAAFLSDALSGDFVVAWPAGQDGGQREVRGRFRRVAGEDFIDAMLLFDLESGRLRGAWNVSDGSHELFPELGSEFQVSNFYLAADGGLAAEPGVTLVFNEAGQLFFERRPLASGAYFLGFAAETAAGERREALADVTVNNDALLPGYRVYLDLQQGFQFLYPAGWPAPAVGGGWLFTGDPAGHSRLTVTLHPDAATSTPAGLKSQALATFGAVDMLFEDEALLGGEGGVGSLRTAYGYDSPDGPHTGVFMTFIRDGLGYVIDVDGLATDEAATLEFVRVLNERWVFRPWAAGRQPGRWVALATEDFTTSVPVDYSYARLDSGWQRISAGDGASFLALRVGPQASEDTLDSVEQWLGLAGKGVDGFVRSEGYPFLLAGNVWTRADFVYPAGDDAIWGFVMATNIAGREVVAWGEASAGRFAEYESQVFLVMVAGLVMSNE